MHVLYLTYDGLTDPLGRSQILPYILGCASKGIQYTIISFEKAERHGESVHVEKLIRDQAVTWIPLQYTKKPPVISTIYDILKMRKQIRQLRSSTIDVIHCRSYVTTYAAFGLKQESKFLFDMRGFWVDERVEGGIWDIKKPLYARLYKWLKKKERLWLEDSDAIVSLTHQGKDEINRLVSRNNIHVIPCCCDTDLFKINEADAALQQKLGIETTERIIGYVGSLGTWYMLNEMLAFFKKGKNKGHMDRFLIVTRDNGNEVMKICDDLNLDRSSVIVQSASREEVARYMSLMHFGLFFIRPTYSKKASSPTKFAEYLSCGIPVITNKGVGDLDDILDRNRVGLSVDLETLEIDTEALNELQDLDREAIRKLATEHFSLNHAVDQYLNTYDQLK